MSRRQCGGRGPRPVLLPLGAPPSLSVSDSSRCPRSTSRDRRLTLVLDDAVMNDSIRRDAVEMRMGVSQSSRRHAWPSAYAQCLDLRSG